MMDFQAEGKYPFPAPLEGWPASETREIPKIRPYSIHHFHSFCSIHFFVKYLFFVQYIMLLIFTLRENKY